MGIRIRFTGLARITVLLALATAMPAALPSTAPAATHHRAKTHRHSHHTLGRGSGRSVSCAAGVCFAGDPFPRGQCTWYAAGRRSDLIGIVHGNAGDWLNEARGRVPEGGTPVVGAIAVWLPYHGGASGYGHVAYVAGAAGGYVTVEDFNWEGEVHHTHRVRASWISGYIYGGPAGNGPGAPPSSPTPPVSTPAPPAPSAPSPSAPQTPTTPAPTPQPNPTPSPGSNPPPQPQPQYFVYRVTGTCRDGSCGLMLRSGPGYSNYAALGLLQEGAEVQVVCQGAGQTVSNGHASSSIWDRLTNGAWVSDFYVSTPNIGTWSPPIPQC